jgi:hypothetical protein
LAKSSAAANRAAFARSSFASRRMVVLSEMARS